ncbi:MAG: hypothetical protein JW940_37400, partial [Polyangiaceae bacterium]|nr:hypothetical protein [Polyangiaceae bacterium]
MSSAGHGSWRFAIGVMLLLGTVRCAEVLDADFHERGGQAPPDISAGAAGLDAAAGATAGTEAGGAT